MKVYKVVLAGREFEVTQDTDGKFIIPEALRGIGSALKPASEIWWLIRKPCSEKTVAANVLKHGTGGINIDASRISGAKRSPEFKNPESKGQFGQTDNSNLVNWDASQGRFPANLVLSHNEDCETECTPGCAVAELDSKSGNLGCVSRFFYCAKASKRDKGEGNTHPTVKNSKLMEYLITMVTPPGAVVLDPFMGSGSTGVAAIKSGFSFIGIEKELEYFKIAEERLKNV